MPCTCSCPSRPSFTRLPRTAPTVSKVVRLCAASRALKLNRASIYIWSSPQPIRRGTLTCRACMSTLIHSFVRADYPCGDMPLTMSSSMPLPTARTAQPTTSIPAQMLNTTTLT